MLLFWPLSRTLSSLATPLATTKLAIFSHDDEQFIHKINGSGINEDIAGYWVERAIIASKPYTGHRQH